jgi:hypothetical protein
MKIAEKVGIEIGVVNRPSNPGYLSAGGGVDWREGINDRAIGSGVSDGGFPDDVDCQRACGLSMGRREDERGGKNRRFNMSRSSKR